MKKNLLFTVLFLSVQLIFSQWTQLGGDIDGEAAGDYFGHSLSLSSNGNRMAIGAYNGGVSNSGHVRIYELQAGNWVQLGTDINGEFGGDRFGWSVSLSANGNIIAIGARYNDGINGVVSGHVRVYEYQEVMPGDWNWVQLGADIDGEDGFDESGYSVSLSGDGSIVAIGAYHNDGINGENSGHVRVYEYQEVVPGDWNWVQLGQDIDGEYAHDWYGESVSLSNDGTVVAIGTHRNDGNGSNSGHARVYQLQAGNWVQLGNDFDGEASHDHAGISVSLNANGNIVAIGANRNDGNGSNSGHVRIFQWNGTSWNQLGGSINGEATQDRSGISVSLSNDGTVIAIGANENDGNGIDSGHVRIYQWDGTSWNQFGADFDGEVSGDESGHSVSLNANGNIVAIGAYLNDGNGIDAGHVRVFYVDPDLDDSSVALGNGSGGNNTTGIQNVFLGDYSGFNNTEGNRNTFVGQQSGYTNTIGNNNTYIGYQSGYTNETGSDNVFLGSQAGYNEAGSDHLYIDNSDTSEPLIWGDFAADALRFNAMVGISNIAQDNALTRILVADPVGNINWREAATLGNDNLGDHQVLQSLVPDIDNTYDLGTNENAFNNIYFDGSLFVNDNEFLHSIDNNIALGIDALGNVSGGSQNTAMGEEALTSTTTGVNNVAIGYRTLYNNTTGSNNTAMGNNARVLWSTASNSTAIGNGALALGSNQVRIGNSSVVSIGGYEPWSHLSDGRFKTNIKEDIPGLDFIEKLRPVSYEVDQSKLQAFLGEETKTSYPNKQAIGFVAQEVDEIVSENKYMFTGVERPQNENDHYSIRYSEFVVPLVKAVQEQQETIESLQQEVSELKNLIYGNPNADNSNIKTLGTTDNAGKDGFALYQNIPNPFDKTATISARVPETVRQAKITIYNLNGLELQSYDLNKRGNVSVEISGGILPSGMYLYALIADDQIIDTKKMILTK